MDNRTRILYEGDNIHFLQSMESESVDLIATDPPYNKNKKFHGIGVSAGQELDDTWTWTEETYRDALQQLDEQGCRATRAVVESAYYAHSPNMAAFVAFMSARAIHFHRVLKPTGSLYLQCDSTASAYLKAMLDSIFGNGENGKPGFRNEIIWKRTYPKNNANKYAVVTDTILFYTKGKQWTWNPYYLPLTNETIKTWYVNDDGDGRGRYNRLQLTRRGIVDCNNESWRGIKRLWKVPSVGHIADVIERDYIHGYKSIQNVYDRLDALDAVGLLHWPDKKGGIPSLKQYVSMSTGASPVSLFDDLPMVRDVPKENIGWATQKPLALYRRIIEVSSNEGDLVLDPFCGSGTTCVAAERLGRNWIGIDISPKTGSIILNRLENECNNLFGGKVSFLQKRRKGV